MTGDQLSLTGDQLSLMGDQLSLTGDQLSLMGDPKQRDQQKSYGLVPAPRPPQTRVSGQALGRCLRAGRSQYRYAIPADEGRNTGTRYVFLIRRLLRWGKF